MTERKILRYGELSSTNLKMRELIKSGIGLENGSVIVADAQSAGRGRLGRSFYSPLGAGLYMSYLISSPDEMYMQYYTSWAAVAVVRALERLAGGARIGIKWVNDLIIGNKKICGILAESALSELGVRNVVIGIGVNVLGAREDYPAELAEKASSLEAELGVRFSRDELLLLIAAELDELLNVNDEKKQLMLSEYRAHCISLGRDISVISPSGTREAYALSVADNYDLIVRYPDGNTEALYSGEVSVRLDGGKYI